MRISSYIPQYRMSSVSIPSSDEPRFGGKGESASGKKLGKAKQWLIGLTATGAVLGGPPTAYVVYQYATTDLPNVSQTAVQKLNDFQGSSLLAKDNTPILMRQKYQHAPVSIKDLPEALQWGLIDTEDQHFYDHGGIDLKGTARALYRDATSQSLAEGGSTLTQQLARMLFLTQEKKLDRKTKEAIYATKLEQELSKKQILELYWNLVYLGEGTYGAGAASEIYFGKPVKELDLAECALLAGLPQAPSAYNPFENPVLALERRTQVLNRMLTVGDHLTAQEKKEAQALNQRARVLKHKADTGALSQEQYSKLARKALKLNPKGQQQSSANQVPIFNQYALKQALDILGIDEQTFWRGGYKVHTSLDLRAEHIAEAQVKKINEENGRTDANKQAALVSLDEKGRIIAYVGSKDTAQSQFDHVQAKRQPGSTFKPLVYAAGFKSKDWMNPNTVYNDEEIHIDDGNGQDWSPENHDQQHQGYMTIARALEESNNIVAVKAAQDIGGDEIIRTAKDMGVTAPLEDRPSMAIGSEEVTPLDMAAAYNTLNNDGKYVKPTAITKIEDRDGNVLYEASSGQKQVLDRQVRDQVVGMMKGVVDSGTGQNARLKSDVAGKTGTTDNYRDSWFVGFAAGGPTTAVWIGNDDNSANDHLYGGNIPAKTWRAYTAQYLKDAPEKHFDLSQAGDIQFNDYDLANLAPSEEQPSPEPTESEWTKPSPSDTEPSPTDDGWTKPSPEVSETPETGEPSASGSPSDGINDAFKQFQ